MIRDSLETVELVFSSCLSLNQSTKRLKTAQPDTVGVTQGLAFYTKLF